MTALLSVLTVFGIFLVDQLIKKRVEKYIQIRGGQQGEKEILGGRLLRRRHHNRGARLNFGESKRIFVAVLSVSLTSVLTVIFLCSLGQRGNRLLRAGLSLLLGGAFSNSYDRLKRGFVVDYVSFNVKWEPLRRIVFNISDFCIIIGALTAALGSAKTA